MKAIRCPRNLVPSAVASSFCLASTTSVKRSPYVNFLPESECTTAVLSGLCEAIASKIGRRGSVAMFTVVVAIDRRQRTGFIALAHVRRCSRIFGKACNVREVGATSIAGGTKGNAPSRLLFSGRQRAHLAASAFVEILDPCSCMKTVAGSVDLCSSEARFDTRRHLGPLSPMVAVQRPIAGIHACHCPLSGLIRFGENLQRCLCFSSENWLGCCEKLIPAESLRGVCSMIYSYKVFVCCKL